MELTEEIRSVFIKSKILKKETIQKPENWASLDWIVNKGLLYCLNDNDIIYLRFNMYIVIDKQNQSFVLNKIVKKIVHRPVAYSEDLIELIKVAKLELAEDIGLSLN